MNINLLPKKSRIQKIYWPVMLSIIVIYALIFVFLMYTNFSNGSSLEEKSNEIVALQTEINNLRAIRQPDPLAVDFKDFQSDIQTLKQFRRDWTQIYQQISTAMPSTARMISLEINEARELVIQSQFTSLQQIAEYTAIVGGFVGIESASATSIELVELANITPTQAPTNSDDAESEDELDQINAFLNRDEFIKNLEKDIPTPKDESEWILNELRWLMAQKSVEDQSGIIIPDIQMPEYLNTDDWTSNGLFSLEEIEEAYDKLDIFKDSVEDPTVSEDVRKLFVYQTTLSIKLKAIDADKEVLP